ncbi:poly [ADP-ribose] polymerase tankyrase-2-like [Hibiscus syriacus]|uniref:poly [ADP-ribose] polymerase tankyrase-2-like n=1 Tax=Hibiscus syriacus TaxID=106335 RepID=UPI0019247EF8|nr:poly [ADP-ribose] polymerase tankyrase-2-like [Hibiscus syriacus]
MQKGSSGASYKDLWHAVVEGSFPDVDFALALLKKNGSNINSRNSLGLTPLHIATWRNNIPIIRRLLASDADPDARDVESGWSSLHRALHFDHLVVVSVLLQSGASITLEDSKCRTPIDLMSRKPLIIARKSNLFQRSIEEEHEFINLISSESNEVCNREDKRTIAPEHIRNEKARRYLSSMRKKPPIPFSQKFPNVDLGALRLLERLLSFDLKDHPTAEEVRLRIPSI